MSEIAGVAAAMMAMSQSQTLDQISASIMKMNAEAEAAVADMLMENARQIQALSVSSDHIIDLFV
ncbi:MAG: hypothetical protein R6W75_06735 [Smithellaceae bacterium]